VLRPERRTPLEELTALLRLPSWLGGVAAPFPRISTPLSAFGPSVLAPVKNPEHALGSDGTRHVSDVAEEL